MKYLCFSSRRVIFVLLLAMGLGLPVSRAMAQFIPAYPTAFNVGCNGDHIEREGGYDAEARIDPEWTVITSTPTILEGTVPVPGAKFPNGEQAKDQAPAEVSEEDIPWSHYTHDLTFVVQPDPEYQSLLSSWLEVQTDANGNIVSQQIAGHHTNMEVEWDNGSTMLEIHHDPRYYDYDRGALPQFVWPSVGNRIWVEGQYIFDCGHPGTPAHFFPAPPTYPPSPPIEVHYKEEVKYSSEIHPPRALVTYRLNHPSTAVLGENINLAPELPGGDWLPVTGQQTLVPVTEADIYVSARGGGAVDHCNLITRHLDAIDGLLSLGITGFDSCDHTGPFQTVNNTNYVFDIYPPGTDYSTKPGGTFQVSVPTRDGSGHDVSLQWRVIDHTSEIPDNLSGPIKTVTAKFCPIDATTGPPTQDENDCPITPAAYPTRLRVILPFKGADANAFAASVLLGWDDIPHPQELAVRTFNIRLHEFEVDHNGEGFTHHGNGDWRVFVDVNGQWKYMSSLSFDRTTNGDNLCNGDSLTDNDDHDCFYFDGQPWTVSVVDGRTIHVAVGGFESDQVDSDFCGYPQFPHLPFYAVLNQVPLILNLPGCDPSVGAGTDLALMNNDRTGTLEFDLFPLTYNFAFPNTVLIDRLGPLSFHTPQTAGDNTNYYVYFTVNELSPPIAPSSSLTVGNPSYTAGTTFVTSATPITLATTSTNDVGFQYRFHRDGVPLPTFSSSPFPVHWTTTDFAVGPRMVPLFLNANDGADGDYAVQYSAQTADGVTEPRNTNRLTLDNTPPVATIAQPTATQYGHSSPLMLNYSVSDGSGSGVKSFTPKMDGQTAMQFGASLDSGQTIYLYSMSLGTHTFSVDSVDNVNNAGTNSVTFTITVTPDSLKGDVTDLAGLGCIDNISQSLIAKISAAQNLISNGQTQAANNTLAALIHEVQAQAGKHISTACKDPSGRSFDPVQLLLEDARYLQASVAGQLAANPVLGWVVNFSGAGIGGVTVNLMSSSATVIATATTDATGFYYFATSALTAGANYSLGVTLPTGFTSSTPASLTFTWSASSVVGNFTLN